MAEFHYYLCRWESRDFGNGLFGWTLPEKSTGGIDLRSVPSASSPVVTSRPYAFVSSTYDPASYSQECPYFGFGDLRTLQPSQSARDAWESHLGHRPESDILADWLMEQLYGLGSVPDGSDTTPTGRPTIAGNLEIYLAGIGLVRRVPKEDHPLVRVIESERIYFARMFQDYNRLADERKDDSLRHVPRRFLGNLCQKYGRDWKEFVPRNLKSHIEGPLAPSTKYTDDFNAPDGPPLGNLLSYDIVGGTWENRNQRAAKIDNNNIFNMARSQSDLSSEDHKCSTETYQTSSTFNGPAVRCSVASEVTLYTYTYLFNIQYILKLLSGSLSILSSYDYLVPPDEGSRFEMEADGSQLTGRYEGTRYAPIATDTSIPGTPKFGLLAYTASTTGTHDNLISEDLHLAPAAPYQSMDACHVAVPENLGGHF